MSEAEDWAGVLRMFRGAVSGRSRAKGAGDGERGRMRGPLGRAGVDIVEEVGSVVAVVDSGEGGGRDGRVTVATILRSVVTEDADS